MRLWLVVIAMAAAVCAAPAAAAAPWDFRPGLQGQGKRGQEAGPPRGGRTSRDERRATPAPPDRSTGRLTEEERRELRRDVDRANKEIYRRPQK